MTTIDLFDPSPPQQEPPEPLPRSALQQQRQGWLATTALTAAAYDDPELIAQCSHAELNGAKIRGILSILNVLIAAAVLAIGAHDTLDIAPNVGIVLGALLVAAFLALLDHYTFVRSAIFPRGVQLMRAGGFTRDVRLGGDVLSRISKGLRIAIALAIGGLEALIVALHLNHSGIEARIEAQYVQDNKPIVEQILKISAADRARILADEETARRLVAKRAGDVDTWVTLESREARRLSARQDSKALKEARTSRADAEKALAEAQVALNKSVHDLRGFDTGQSRGVSETISRTPGQIPRDRSFNNRVRMLFAGFADNPWSIIPSALIDLFVLGLDLAVCTISGIAVPSNYSMLEARRTIRAMTEIAAHVLPSGPPSQSRSETTHSPAPSPMSPANNGQEMPRRGRGRPRGSTNKPSTNGASHG